MGKAGDLLREGLKELGYSDTAGLLDPFSTYLRELKKWNRAHNISGLRTDREIVIKHFLDSLLYCRVLPETVQSLADIGSGAGFPGIPIKIINPRLRVFLVEPTRKKAIFLRYISGKLGLQGIEVIDRRIEDVEGLKVDAAVTRALFSVREFMEKAQGILNENGILILSKGPKVNDELKDGALSNIVIKDLNLPILNITRRLVLVKSSSLENRAGIKLPLSFSSPDQLKG